MTSTRLRPLIPLALVATLALAACGGDDKTAVKPAPGSPENPLVGKTYAQPTTPGAEAQAPSRSPSKGAAAERSTTKSSGAASKRGSADSAPVGEPTARGNTSRPPGYDALVQNQTSAPNSRSTPCSLVTEPEARAIIGAPIQAPLEAPQGPTCIYRTQRGHELIALAVQATKFSELKRRIRGERAVSVAGRDAVCGKLGQPMLYVPLAGGKVLSVTASCSVATRFASKALPRL